MWSFGSLASMALVIHKIFMALLDSRLCRVILSIWGVLVAKPKGLRDVPLNLCPVPTTWYMAAIGKIVKEEYPALRAAMQPWIDRWSATLHKSSTAGMIEAEKAKSENIPASKVPVDTSGHLGRNLEEKVGTSRVLSEEEKVQCMKHFFQYQKFEVMWVEDKDKKVPLKSEATLKTESNLKYSTFAGNTRDENLEELRKHGLKGAPSRVMTAPKVHKDDLKDD